LATCRFADWQSACHGLRLARRYHNGARRLPAGDTADYQLPVCATKKPQSLQGLREFSQRPSPAAEVSGVAKALERGQVDKLTSVSAPEDGRTPFGG
jgi:hypothetical protein